MIRFPIKNCKGCREDLPIFMFKDKFRERISPFCWECVRMKEEIRRENKWVKERRKALKEGREPPPPPKTSRRETDTQVSEIDTRATDISDTRPPINPMQIVLALLMEKAKSNGDDGDVKILDSLIENSAKVY